MKWQMPFPHKSCSSDCICCTLVNKSYSILFREMKSNLSTNDQIIRNWKYRDTSHGGNLEGDGGHLNLKFFQFWGGCKNRLCFPEVFKFEMTHFQHPSPNEKLEHLWDLGKRGENVDYMETKHVPFISLFTANCIPVSILVGSDDTWKKIYTWLKLVINGIIPFLSILILNILLIKTLIDRTQVRSFYNKGQIIDLFSIVRKDHLNDKMDQI